MVGGDVSSYAVREPNGMADVVPATTLASGFVLLGSSLPRRGEWQAEERRSGGYRGGGKVMSVLGM